MRHPTGRDTVPAARILRRGARSGRLMHVEEIAARPGEGVPWPEWVPEQITQAFSEAGVTMRDTKDLWDLPLVFAVLVLLRFSEWWLRRRWGIV